MGGSLTTKWIFDDRPCDDCRVKRPGLAKVRHPPLVVARPGVRLQSSDAAWRELFERADVVSEGSVHAELDGRSWYGSTSMILRAPPDADPVLLAQVAERNVHVRLRAVRTALREASLRAPGRLGRLMCELRISPDPVGVRIDVDVQAPLIERRATSRAAP
jgi:hypothetical protein